MIFQELLRGEKKLKIKMSSIITKVKIKKLILSTRQSTNE